MQTGPFVASLTLMAQMKGVEHNNKPGLSHLVADESGAAALITPLPCSERILGAASSELSAHY